LLVLGIWLGWTIIYGWNPLAGLIHTPEIFNSDQGSQFTSSDFTCILEDNGIKISMDGRGRLYDNIFVERLWRTVKYEEVYLKDYSDMHEAKICLGRYFDFYNTERPHQSLKNMTPEEVYYGLDEKVNRTILQAVGA